MIKRLILILSFIFFLISHVYSEELLIGLKTGFNNPNFFEVDFLKHNSDLFMGLNYEIAPKKSLFSYSMEVQYSFNPKLILIPISINFRPGNRIKYIASGGILPTIRLNRVDPENTMDIGGLFKIGIDYRINKTISLYSNFGFYFIPNRYYYYSHFGGKYLEKTIEYGQFINLGINYIISNSED